ncbi:carbohydrate-binding protein [Massilia sp. Root335]|uniref:carbohydrate-binding protein n=1 Tax=Massilia sp. Root335 TaxID=1736517 RepID=UPI00138F73FA|nr:carbohydrate-binding protein [Massilia sp. Root335]
MRASSSGTRSLVIRCANGGTAARTVSVTLNGVASNVTFPVTGSWNDYQQMTLSTPLNSGTTNSVRIQSAGQDGPNIDEIGTR